MAGELGWMRFRKGLNGQSKVEIGIERSSRMIDSELDDSQSIGLKGESIWTRYINTR